MTFASDTPVRRNESIKVLQLVDQLKDRLDIDLKLCIQETGWEDNEVVEADLYRPGLALAGFVELFTHQRIQVLGNTECQYLGYLSKEKREQAFENLLDFDIPVIFLTDANSLARPLLKKAARCDIPVFKTPLETVPFLVSVRDFLEDYFALQTMVHGSMMDVYGVGMLIAGKSGIGKSEVALDLIERGHRLVADDVVMFSKKNNVLMTAPTEINKHFMEIRGLGIIDIMSMFGIRGIRYQKRLEMVIELQLWDESENVERTGLNHDFVSILGIDIPRVKLPITPGKNITVIAEVIAMNHLLRHYGYDPAKAFQEKVKRRIADKKEHSSDFPARSIKYFEGDIE